MIATIYSLPSWIANPDNKPSYQLFQTFINNPVTLEAKTIEQPTLTTLTIQSSYTVENWYKYNYVKFKDLWYVIKDVSYLSENNNVVSINAELDIYLSFVVSYFDTTKTFNNLVFFKQKHLNRYFYNSDGSTCLNFEQQFYLKNKHQALADIGKNNVKNTDWLNYQNYTGFNAGLTSYSEETLDSVLGIGYIYAIWQITANETNQSMINQLPTFGLINIGPNGKGMTAGPNGSAYNYPWWAILKGVGDVSYLDFIVLPVPIEYAYAGNSFEYLPNTGLFTTLKDFAPNTIGNTYWNDNVIVWSVMPQNLYYFFDVNNLYQVNNYNAFSNVYDSEPYLFQYCNFRVRGAGEDSIVDITYFNNVTATTFINTLYSFVINLNHPTTQITNILYNVMLYYSQNINTSFSIMTPYMFNTINDVYYVLNWKLIYPSLSNNWNNYLTTNLNQYHTALNIAHYGLQKSQADLAFDSIKAATGAVSGFFSGGISGAVNGAVNGAESLTNGTFNELTQQTEYNYLNTGKKADMSRTSNARLATNNNAISYNNFTVSFVFECPPQYEQNIAVAYCYLNGYVLNRWEPFSYWHNRQLVNYVKCQYFTDAMMSQMNQTYKGMIDKLFNNGFRVWLPIMGISYETVPFNQLNLQTGTYNLEINQNNNEINYLIQQGIEYD